MAYFFGTLYSHIYSIDFSCMYELTKRFQQCMYELAKFQQSVGTKTALYMYEN